MSRSLVMQITFSVIMYFDVCLEFTLQNYEGCLNNISSWTILIKNGFLTDILYDAYASPLM